MQHRMRVYVQQHREGGVFAFPLALPSVSASAPTSEAALAALKTKLEDDYSYHLANVGDELVFRERQELRALALELTPREHPDGPPIPISVDIVITLEDGSRGPRIVVTAPRIPKLHLVVEQAERVDELVLAELQRIAARWKGQRIVAADNVGPTSLHTLLVEIAGDASGDAAEGTVLAACGSNLSQRAETGRLTRAERRDALVERIITLLAAPSHSSVMLVGPPDVGKTTLVYELIERLREGRVPEQLAGRAVWSVSGDQLIAGQRYVGDWQERAKQLTSEVERSREILYMGNPAELLDAGKWTQSDNNLGRFLRSFIESGAINVVCETTPEGWEAGLRSEPSFMHAFNRVDVPPTDEAETLAILAAAARRLEASERAVIDQGALDAALELTRRFLPYRAFPGKAVRFVEDAVRDTDPPPGTNAPRVVGREQAIASFVHATGLPELIVSDAATLHLPTVRAFFDERLLGQPEAVAAMVDLVTVLKAGLNDPHKPLGSFFFVGPTGVGKTELCKALAEFLFGGRERMARFDMSEYAAADALPRLIGSAWSNAKDGELTRRVREQPFCVVLLDEVEKAHPDVFDALLGVLGEGRLTDAGGRSTDFRNAIVIMTSNLGAGRRELQSVGFGAAAAETDDAWLRQHFVEQAERFFRPEFFNRIDRVVAFRPLGQRAMRLIARRELGKLLMREGVVRRGLLVEIDDGVIDTLVERGFDLQYGARPLQREIERLVMLPLARLVVDRRADGDHLLRFGVRDGAIELALAPLDSGDEQQPSDERRVDHTLRAITSALATLLERVTADEHSPMLHGARAEVSRLLARTREPGFWDDGEAARGSMNRVYQLERVIKRRDALAGRAEALAEQARQMRIHRDRRRLGELGRDVAALEADWEFMQLELAAVATGSGGDEAVLRVTPIGRDNEKWAARVLAMYRAWAERKGYDQRAFDPQGDAGGAEQPPAALYVRGANVYDFLRGEAGLHNAVVGEAGAQQRWLARVAVVRITGGESEDRGGGEHSDAQLRRLLRAAELPDAGDGAIARRYSLDGRHRMVRDPRTGVRLADVQAVLERGEIDAFLMATLRREVEPK